MQRFGARITSALALLLVVLPGCTSNDEADASRARADGATSEGPSEAADDAELALGEVAETANWTFLVYLMGDNDLEPFAIQDLEEMLAVPHTDAVNIVSLVDRHPEYDAGDVEGIGDFRDTKLVDARGGELTVLQETGELNQGDPATLASFVAGAVEAYPAERYALIFWDHGGGWFGMGPDESQNDSLSIPDLVEGIGAGLEEAGVDRLDLVGFDACLMATWEVADAMAPFADYFLASEELEPGHGWDYSSLAALAEDPEMDAVELGQNIIDGFEAHANDWGTAGNITLSLVDLAEIDGVSDAVDGLMDALSAAPDFGTVMGKAIQRSLAFASNPDPSQSYHLYDLGDLARQVAAVSPGMAAATDEVLAALETAVVSQVRGPTQSAATGLSLYSPHSADYLWEGYEQVGTAASGWTNALQSFHGASRSRGPDAPQIRFSQEVDIAENDLGDLVGFAELAPEGLDQIVSAYGQLGTEIDGEIVFVAEVPAVIDGQEVVAEIPPHELYVVVGDDAEPVYLVWGEVENGISKAEIDLEYVGPDGEVSEVILSVAIDYESLEVSSPVFYRVTGERTLGQFIPDAGGRFYPVFPVEDGEFLEWAYYEDIWFLADTTSLEFVFLELEPGTEAVLDLVVEDVAGNGISSGAAFTY